MNYLLTVFLALVWCVPVLAAQADYARRIAPLIDPAKLATLGKRGCAQMVERLSRLSAISITAAIGLFLAVW
jgi:hypothetical protein